MDSTSGFCSVPPLSRYELALKYDLFYASKCESGVLTDCPRYVPTSTHLRSMLRLPRIKRSIHPYGKVEEIPIDDS